MGRAQKGRGWVVFLLGVLAVAVALGSGDETPVSCQRLGLRVARVGLDAAVKDIVWLTGQVVLIITKKNTLYRSGDDGRTFQSVMDQLEDSETEEAPYANGVMGKISQKYSITFCSKYNRPLTFPDYL